MSLSRQRHGSNNHRETVSHQSTPTRLKLAPDHRHGSSSANKHSSTSDNRHSSTHSTPRSSSMDTSSSPGVAAERTSHKPVINGNGELMMSVTFVHSVDCLVSSVYVLLVFKLGKYRKLLQLLKRIKDH